MAGNYLWQGTFKTLQALIFFLIPPFSKFGTEDCPPPPSRKRGGGGLILCIHNIVHVNCRTYTYFFPKQTGYYFCYYYIIVIKIITIIIAITIISSSSIGKISVSLTISTSIFNFNKSIFVYVVNIRFICYGKIYLFTDFVQSSLFYFLCLW